MATRKLKTSTRTTIDLCLMHYHVAQGPFMGTREEKKDLHARIKKAFPKVAWIEDGPGKCVVCLGEV